jgi:hypothetical protein
MPDLRVPVGSFFVLLGLILLGMGILTPGEHASLTDANVNLYCAFPMLAFGGFLLLLAWRAARRPS